MQISNITLKLQDLSDLSHNSVAHSVAVLCPTYSIFFAFMQESQPVWPRTRRCVFVGRVTCMCRVDVTAHPTPLRQHLSLSKGFFMLNDKGSVLFCGTVIH